MSRRERTSISPALAVSAVLHVGAALAVILLGGLFKKPFEVGGGVPVTLVTQGPPEMIHAPIADEIQEAQTEEPDPVAEPEPAPAPPTPTPPKPPAPTPKPTPKPTPTPTPKKPSPRAELDLDRLLADVQPTRPGKPSPPRKPGGAKGPPKDATTIQIGSGKRVSAATKGYLLTLGEEFGRTWRPNCLVEGGSEVKVTVTFTVGPGGVLLTTPDKKPRSSANGSGSMEVAASERAKRAVYAAKFKDFPPELWGEELSAPFDASLVCGNR